MKKNRSSVFCSSLRGRHTHLFFRRPAHVNSIALLCICLITSLYGWSQSPEDLLQQGMQLETKFQDADALKGYLEILEQDSSHLCALIRASKLCSRLGGRRENKSEKKELVLKAKAFACRAIEADNLNADAHFQYIVALGLLSEMADNPADKLENARIIKQESETVLRLDSNYAGVYYILGKWNDALSGLNWIERIIAQTLLGGMPSGASHPEALRCFQHAIDLQPDYILFYYGLAKALADHGQHAMALKTLEQAILLPELEPDDKIRKENCKRLIIQLKTQKV